MSQVNAESEVKEISMKSEKMLHQMHDDFMRCFSNIAYNENMGKVAAYLLYKVSSSINPFGFDYKSLFMKNSGIHTDILNYVKAYFSEDIWDNLKKLLSKYSEEDFLYMIFSETTTKFSLGDVNTPKSIIELANSILNIQKNDSVADICCGVGSFIKSSFDRCPDARYYGFELNVECSIVSRIRAEILDADIDIRLTDVFDLVNDNNSRFMKIFSNYPFGMRIKGLGEGANYFKKLVSRDSSIANATSSDWIFNSLIVDLLADNGKAVAIMTNGSTWNSIDMPMRRYFVEKGFIESVISLPAKMFMNSPIATTMVVFSKGNENVRMVDASDLYLAGRRYNEFKKSDIETIIRALDEDSDISRLIAKKDMRENEYSLSLGRYLKKDDPVKNGVTFESLIKSITRGAPCTAAQLDAMSSPTATNMQYLMLSDIQDGTISKDLRYLKTLDDSLEKYCLKDRDLIISKNGYPYKIAVAEIKGDKKILANGNLFIIEVDEEKVDPYYLKALFEGDRGISLLKGITVGATIPSIGVSALKSILIPLPSITEQRKLVVKYLEIQDEVEMLRMRLARTADKARHIVDDYMKED